MFPQLHAQAAQGPAAPSAQLPSPATAGAPPVGRAPREYRPRSRSFDAAFVQQLHAFHCSQQAAQNKQLQQQQMQRQQMTPQQLQQQQLQQAWIAMQAAAAMPPINAAHAAHSAQSLSPRPHRERQLRSAYLSPSGMQPPASARPASPPSPATIAAAAAATNGNGSNSARFQSNPRAARAQLQQPQSLSPPAQSSAAAGYNGFFTPQGHNRALQAPSPAIPFAPLQPMFPGLIPPQQLLQQTQLLQLQHQQLMQHLSMQQAANGKPFYGFLNVGASSPRPGEPLSPPSFSPALPMPMPMQMPVAATPVYSHSPAAHTAQSSMPALPLSPPPSSPRKPAKPRILHVHPTVPGENHARSRPAHRSMLELHNEYIEVVYTDATRGGPQMTSSAQQAAARKKLKKEKAARAAALASAAGAADASAAAAVVPEAPPLTVDEMKMHAKLASAAMLAEIQARRDKANQRMKGREAAALQRITEQEAERTRAAEAEKAKAAKLEAEKAKQRAAMAEAALSRAKQAEQSKARSALLDEIEAKAKERESKALARLKASQPPASLFNPTLAYALKVESSHMKGDARSPRKGDITRGPRGSVIHTAHASGAAAAAVGFSAEKTLSAAAAEKAAARAAMHVRKGSLYDGMDIDMMSTLHESSSASSSGASAGAGTATGAGLPEDHDVVHEEDEEVMDEEGDAGAGADGEEDHAAALEEEKTESTAAHATGTSAAPQNISPVAASRSKDAAAPTGKSPSGRPKHGRTLSTIARDHIASQLNKITTKHTGASVKVQRLRNQTKARAQAAQAEKQRKMDEIRLAREAELRRMAEALTAMEASTGGGAKVESQFVLAMPLAKAAKAADLQAIEELARDKRETGGDIVAWVNRHDSAGSTAIFHATWMAHAATLELLFSFGANPDHVNNRKNTALHLACDRAHYAIVKLLLDHGSNPTLRNHEERCCYEMQSRNSAESLEMALYIRQCLEDRIVERSDMGAAAKGVGLGMASVKVETHGGAGGEGGSSAADTPSAGAVAAAAASNSTDPTDPARVARVRLVASAVSSTSDPSLVQTHQYLESINAYISKRIHLSASLRRVKMKIWSSVRLKLRLGAFSSMAKQRALETQQEAEREAAKVIAAEAAQAAGGGSAEHHTEQEQEQEAAASIPASS